MKNKYYLISLISLLATACSEKKISEPQITKPIVVERVAPVLVTNVDPIVIEQKGEVAKVDLILPVQFTTVGRIWTSIDGRTMEAELLARTTDVIRIRRNSDQKEFSLPLKNISELDREYVNKSGVPITVFAKTNDAPLKIVPQFNAARLAILKSTIPPISAIAPLDSNDQNLINIFSSYKRNIESINAVGYARHIQLLRDKMVSDIAKLTPTAASNVANPPIFSPLYGVWSKGSGAWKEIWAARSTLAWLNGPLRNYITELEALK